MRIMNRINDETKLLTDNVHTIIDIGILYIIYTVTMLLHINYFLQTGGGKCKMISRKT